MFHDSRKVPTRWYDSAGVPSYPFLRVSPYLPFLIEEGMLGGRLKTFLGNNTETQMHVFQSPLVPVASWIFSGGCAAASFDLLVIWKVNSTLRKGSRWIRDISIPSFPSSFHYSWTGPHPSPPVVSLWVSLFPPRVLPPCTEDKCVIFEVQSTNYILSC